MQKGWFIRDVRFDSRLDFKIKAGLRWIFLFFVFSISEVQEVCFYSISLTGQRFSMEKKFNGTRESDPFSSPLWVKSLMICLLRLVNIWTWDHCLSEHNHQQKLSVAPTDQTAFTLTTVFGVIAQPTAFHIKLRDSVENNVWILYCGCSTFMWDLWGTDIFQFCIKCRSFVLML